MYINQFDSKEWKDFINGQMKNLGDIPKSEKMEIINNEIGMSSISNGVRTEMIPYKEKDIFLVKLSENVGTTTRDLEMSEIIKYSEYCYGIVNLVKGLDTLLLSYSDVLLLTSYLKLLNKYDNMFFFLRGMTVEQYNKNIKILKFDDDKTLLSL